jgi:hypothetical protein
MRERAIACGVFHHRVSSTIGCELTLVTAPDRTKDVLCSSRHDQVVMLLLKEPLSRASRQKYDP